MLHHLVEVLIAEVGDQLRLSQRGHELLADDAHQVFVSLDDEYFQLRVVRRGGRFALIFVFIFILFAPDHASSFLFLSQNVNLHENESMEDPS